MLFKQLKRLGSGFAVLYFQTFVLLQLNLLHCFLFIKYFRMISPVVQLFLLWNWFLLSGEVLQVLFVNLLQQVSVRLFCSHLLEISNNVVSRVVLLSICIKYYYFNCFISKYMRLVIKERKTITSSFIRAAFWVPLSAASSSRSSI